MYPCLESWRGKCQLKDPYLESKQESGTATKKHPKLNWSLSNDYVKLPWVWSISFMIFPCFTQGFVKGEVFCFRYPYFYFQHGESTFTASQLTSPASQKSKDLNKVLLLLQDLVSISFLIVPCFYLEIIECPLLFDEGE